MDRYDGKPFLRLLDCYVLRAIGELSGPQTIALANMEPKLAQVYGISAAWHEIVAQQMSFPENLPAHILEIWQTGQRRAAELGLEADPREFTMQFVDTNFPR